MPRKHPTSDAARTAQRASQRAWYRRNKASHYVLVKANSARRNARIRADVDAIKSQPCTDCGGTFDPICMDFDHRPGEIKVADVARLATGGSEARLYAEIAKCDVVCSNCHRLRTKRRRLGS